MKTRVILLVLFLGAAPASTADLWWAVAKGYYEHNNPSWPPVSMPAYGAAWNYPTKEAAEEAAVTECQKSHKPCHAILGGRNQCFAVGYNDNEPRSYVAERFNIQTGVNYQVLIGENKAAMQRVIDYHKKYARYGGKFIIDMTACSGAN